MIKILDCTLRDGGYVNNWEFGKKSIINIVDKLLSANIDIIECGFISHTKELGENKSIFKNTDSLRIENRSKTKIAAMINYGEVDVNNIINRNVNTVDIIRIAFHKKDYVGAVDLCNSYAEKGYEVFLQPMNALNYTDEEYTNLIKIANNSKITAFYLVDTFGNMQKSDIEHYYTIIQRNLSPKIIIGFHSHNNLQLSFSNAQRIINLAKGRDLIIDSSLFGMGRGAGNLCTELLSNYLNVEYKYHYDMLPILEIIDTTLIPIYNSTYWGYSLPYYLASINSCHPNYATHLVFKQTLTIKDINNIISQIPKNIKTQFNEDYIEELYKNYQSKHIDDSDAINKIRSIIKGRDVLIIAPGRSIITNKQMINTFINTNDLLVVGLNVKYDEFDTEVTFVSNAKRFEKLKKIDKDINLIYTSNICSDNGICVDYGSLTHDDTMIADNAGLLAINLFVKCGVTTIYLSGYDGYQIQDNKNYFNSEYKLVKNASEVTDRNEKMKKAIALLKNRGINIKFLTPSLYFIK